MKIKNLVPVLALLIGFSIPLSAQLIDAKMSERCKELRNGTFISTIDDGATWVEIERSNNRQIERQGDIETTNRIKWTSDCSYDIALQSVSDDLSDEDIRGTFRVTIDKIEGDKYYYTFYNVAEKTKFSGYMKKLK